MDERLAGLQELSLPGPVSYMPQTVAWYVLLALAVVALAWLIRRWRRRRLANRYRGEALGRLDEIASQVNDRDRRAAALASLPALVKQTALSFASRELVAQLSGDAWLSFLDSTYSGTAFTSGPGRLLPALAYRPPAALESVPNEQVSELIELLRQWIRRHHVRV